MYIIIIIIIIILQLPPRNKDFARFFLAVALKRSVLSRKCQLART